MCMVKRGIDGHKCLEGIMANSRWGETKIHYPNGVVITIPANGLRKKDGAFKKNWTIRIKSYLTVEDATWIYEHGGQVEIKKVIKKAAQFFSLSLLCINRLGGVI